MNPISSIINNTENQIPQSLRLYTPTKATTKSIENNSIEVIKLNYQAIIYNSEPAGILIHTKQAADPL